MGFYLIGLGLNERGISLHGKKVLKNCKKIYLETYTVDFPYKKKDLEKQLKIKVIEANRENVESESIVLEAKKQDVALLIYGSPLSATTHISLINRCKKEKIKFKVFHSGSVVDAIAESGLSLYRFGKIASLPKWQKSFQPKSFIEFIKQNQSIKAHSLLLVDIGLSFKEAVIQLEQTKFKLGKVIVGSCLGVKSKFFYGNLNEIDAEKVKPPYCFIIPGEMEKYEEEALEIAVRG